MAGGSHSIGRRASGWWAGWRRQILHEELLRCVEPPLLEELMRRLQGNRVVAAQWLGLNRATVRKKLAEYDLSNVHRPAQKPADDDDDG